MNKTKISVGEAIVRFLDNQYVIFDEKTIKFVEGVFTLFGHGCVLGVGEALAECNHSLKIYQGKNEQGMAHAAISYAKQNNRRKILPCLSSIGPGSANMLTAAATATVNNIPLLLLLGDTYASRHPDPVLQQVEQPHDLSITTNDAFRPLVKFFDRIYRPEMLESALLNAMRLLTDPANTGAVALALPQDVQGEVYEFSPDLFKPRYHHILRQECTNIEIKEAVKLIFNAKYPLMIIGGGARYSEAGDIISKIASKHKIPFAETQAGKSTIPSSHEYYLGGIGVTGNSMANSIAQKADLIIGFGTRFSDFTTSSKTLFSNAKILAINASLFHASKLDSTRVICDCKRFCESLAPLISDYMTEYTDEINKAQEAWQNEYERLSSVVFNKVNFKPEVHSMTPSVINDFEKITSTTICQTSAVALIRKKITPDAIIVGASGSLPGCLQRMWTTNSLYSYNMEYGYSCMGYEIAGALGSKIAEPTKEVYAMAGDGSYLMLHSEIVTSIQENIKIIVLLFDNGGFGCINNLQMGKGISSLATEFRKFAQASSDFVPIDYAQSARAYGCEAYTVRTLDELSDALEKAHQNTITTLIDIKVFPKTMTDGYTGGFWETGLTHAPHNSLQAKVLKSQLQILKDHARKGCNNCN
ncbi:MAG: 3D-(3,5/4)-trihydroxycyclohexane-1,2-dione acylhydrolase (decyclizing) [Christensenellaceae bacterium]|jgi:3D-(3,5/4)-trihydroxycyclohexane-1,2-dione acylhydrolase (decyclizing)|nr:3D-(3,5/4)-trihydroxycyclohexane-1,2-dione acylhydrolase (decyclizing) [Christensenellaceae bacterium]